MRVSLEKMASICCTLLTPLKSMLKTSGPPSMQAQLSSSAPIPYETLVLNCKASTKWLLNSSDRVKAGERLFWEGRKNVCSGKAKITNQIFILRPFRREKLKKKIIFRHRARPKINSRCPRRGNIFSFKQNKYNWWRALIKCTIWHHTHQIFLIVYEISKGFSLWYRDACQSRNFWGNSIYRKRK